jgi:hypothetical protein
MDALSNEELLERWKTETTFEQRDAMLELLQKRELFPRLMEAQDEWEDEAGLYPDSSDPKFTEKLMSKQEFAENKQKSIREQQEEGVNPCDAEKEFELTPVQRFIGRYLSPQCPYNSALLYHGVGVGKTCAAVTVAENYLRSFPRRSVIIVAPKIIQAGFRTTLFDPSEDGLQIPESDTEPNLCVRSCTGNTYLKRTGMEFEKNRDVIRRAVNESISMRYTFFGYIQFNSYIESVLARVPQGLSEEAARIQREKLLRREFSGRLLIIDEAHNLRDGAGEAEDEDRDVAGGDAELSEAKAGKKLTPNLIRVLESSDGMKLMLLTGTPMYNTYREIIFLLNLMLINDKKATLSERDIFLPSGAFRPAGEGHKSGEEILGSVASAYVSFMRGENPLSFPIRLYPEDTPKMTEWPQRSPDAVEITPLARERMAKFPFVPVQYEGESQREYLRISEEAIQAGGVGVNSIDEMVQSGNWLFPAEGGVQHRDAGFKTCFQDRSEEAGSSGATSYKSRTGPPTWLLAKNLGTASPKAKLILNRLQTSRGITFVYSRFIRSGALPLALALEANGYTMYDREKPLLEDGIQDDLGRQCAMCPRRERQHAGAGHPFVAAKYILLTGKSSISKSNAEMVKAARRKSNLNGGQIKVILGSSVASEGVDFRFVREMFVFDSWFHLNKLEQVLGRGIRTCSHALLPAEQRNCTIYLLVNQFAQDQETETADMYMYRQGLAKAIQIGRVTRVLKRYALDCNLNREAIYITGLAKQRQVDAQRKDRGEVDINDTPFSSLCDWLETCEYKCAHPVEIQEDDLDSSTYDEYAARWREAQLKSAIKKLFDTPQKRTNSKGEQVPVGEQTFLKLEQIQEQFDAVPPSVISGLLSEIVGNRSFRLRVRGTEGYLVYRNGYYVFQPDYLSDVRTPLALRVAEVPVRRDHFEARNFRAPAAVQKGVPPPPRAEVAAEAATGPVVAPVAAVPPAEGMPSASARSLAAYWVALKEWAEKIRAGTAPLEDIPPAVLTAIDARYQGGELAREKDQLIMFNWMYEHIQTTEEIEEAKRAPYRAILAEILLEFLWDGNLKPMEQRELYRTTDAAVRTVAAEQIQRIGEREAFRYVHPITGAIVYICGTEVCEPSVARVFDESAADPLNRTEINTETTGKIYGFLVPKSKEGRLIFKTAEKLPQPGGTVEKGLECYNNSNISAHIRMLKEIGDILAEEGYPRFLLREEILDEKTRKHAERKAAKAAGEKYVPRPFNPRRVFENAIRACALKEIALRWIDKANRGGAAGGGPVRLRYFYRPVSAKKGKQKGVVAKGGGYLEEEDEMAMA